MLAATHSWEAVSALAAAGGAIAAAVGSVAAWRAASASRATSRDALEALAVGIRPQLVIDFDGVARANADGEPPPGALVAEVSSISDWAATDLRLEVRFRDGRLVHRTTERLAPSSVGTGVEGRAWTVAIDPGEPADRAPESAALRFSDERRIARYEITVGFFFNEDAQQGNSVELTGTRIG